MTISNATGFTPVKAATLPKGLVVGNSSTKDGAYLICQNKGKFKTGQLLISTAGGHLYKFKCNGNGLEGLGKSRYGALDGVFLQKVSFDVVIKAFRATAKKKVIKKVSKKKVAKKKRAKRVNW